MTRLIFSFLILLALRRLAYLLSDRIFESPRRTSRSRLSSSELIRRQRDFLILAFSMLGKLAKVDGRVSELEISVLTQYLDIYFSANPELRELAIQSFRAAKDSGTSFESYTKQFYTRFANDEVLLSAMIRLLREVAGADGAYHPREEEMIQYACKKFGFPYFTSSSRDGTPDSSQKTSTEIPRGNLDKAYAALGASSRDSTTELKKKYRTLVRTHHPDTAVAQGLPPELIKLAEERFKEIQLAWEKVSQYRGI